jgi:uncharacterized protein
MTQLKKQQEPFDPADFVAEHLEANPDFFESHLELLAKLQIPHPSGDAISLVERQLQVLRNENEKLSAQQDQLISNFRDNKELFEQLDQLRLDLFDSGNLDDVLTTVFQSLSEGFNVEMFSLKLFSADKNLQKKMHFDSSEKKSLFEHLFKYEKALCSRLNEKQKNYLFEEMRDEVKSTALIPIIDDKITGVLALGSTDESRYHPGRGNDLLNQLGALLSKVISVKLSQETT